MQNWCGRIRASIRANSCIAFRESNTNSNGDAEYERPGWRTRLFAAFVRVLPKFGPLKSSDITLPTTDTEDLYIKSVNKTVDVYRGQLAELRNNRRAFSLPNRDCDTGNPTTPNEYNLADE